MPNDEASPDISVASLKRLWPNREHESNWLKNALCGLHLHRWHELDIGRLVPNEKASFCRWCSKIRFRGRIYE
jgi:hypothetical protein